MRESDIAQIFKRDGFSVAINFSGSTNPNALTGTGDTDFSQQAMKPYLEIDTARGSTTAQVDDDGNFTQQQEFTLTGTKGSRSFKFKKGASVADLVQQIHSSADSTGVDAALIFNSAQRIDRLGNGNGEFAPMVENKFKLDGMVNEKGESLYLSVSYEEKYKDQVDLSAFDPGLDLQVSMNDELDAYGRPTYSVTLGGSTLLSQWDGKADTFNRELASITASNTNPGDEFAHLKYMNFRMDTDIDTRESFKGQGIFRWDSAATALTSTIPAGFSSTGGHAASTIAVDFSGVDPDLFAGGAPIFTAAVNTANDDMLTITVNRDGESHSIDIPLSAVFPAAAPNPDVVIGATHTTNELLHGIKITGGGNTAAWINGTDVIGTSNSQELSAPTTNVGLVPNAALPSSTIRLTKTGIDNIPEQPRPVAKPVMPRALVEEPVDPDTITPPIAPTLPVNPNGTTARPAAERDISPFVTSNLPGVGGVSVDFNLLGYGGLPDGQQQALLDLMTAIDDQDVRLDVTTNGDGSVLGSGLPTYSVKLVVGTGPAEKSYDLAANWDGASNIVYNPTAANDPGDDMSKALKKLQFQPTVAVDRAADIVDEIDFSGLIGKITVVNPFGATTGSTVDLDLSALDNTFWRTNLSAADLLAIANGTALTVSVTGAMAGAAPARTGSLAISVQVGTNTPVAVETISGLAFDANGTSTGGIKYKLNNINNTDFQNTATGATVSATPAAKTKWLGGNAPSTSTSSTDSTSFAAIVAQDALQKVWDENDKNFDDAMLQYNRELAIFHQETAALASLRANYPAALAAYEADQARLVDAMKTYNAELKDYNIYREKVLKFEAGTNVVKNGVPLGTDLVPDPGAVTGGVAMGEEASSVARNVGTVAVFNNELDPDGSGKVMRGVSGVALSDEAADSIHFGKNTDGQGRVFVKFLDDNSFELYKDSSMSAESLVATGINGREIKEANNSGLKGLTLNLAKDAGGDLPAVKGVYIALAGIEGRSTNVDQNGNSYDGVVYDKDVVNTPRTVEKVATQEDVDAALLEDPASTLKVGDKFKVQTYEGSGCFDSDRTLITGVELGRNTSDEGKIYLKNIFDEKTGTLQVFAYKNDRMRDEDMVAKSEIYKVTGDDGTDASSITVVLNEVRVSDKTDGTGLGIVLSVDAAAFKGVESSTLTGSIQFTNLGARVFAQDYGTGSTLKITQDKGGIFSYYQSPGVDGSKRVIEAEENKGVTVELKGQDATLSINGAQVFTDGLKLSMANQDIQANLVFNTGKVGSTTLAQVGYDAGSIFTKAGALNVGSAEMNEDGISGQLCNAGHTTNEKLDGFQGGMQLQLGEGAGDQNRTVVAIKSLAADNIGRVVKGGYWETGKAVWTEKMFTMKDVMGGGYACLRTDPVLAMSIIEVAINDVAEVRAQIGAMQANLLQTNSNNLSVTMENIQKTESGIRDADMADEMTEFTKNQVLQSAATSMLANANQSSQNVLQLLQ
ncbi:MAG: hypothetical protein LUE17_01385 [Planctomycetaceae bacterium]|nr:hypothetical protein [Planctomycetaceae bacterium]